MLTIIAELGINHNGNKALLFELCRSAIINGADYVKVQLYSSMALFGDDSRSYLELDYDTINDLKMYTEDHGKELVASVFDHERLEWCEKLGMKRYKIASRTLRDDKEFTGDVVNVGKPVYISLGMHQEIDPQFFIKANVSLFYCVSEYPAYYPEERVVFSFSDKFCGWSDHCLGISYALFAIANGASFIEKHYTLDKSDMTHRDHIGSMNANELMILNTYGRELHRTYKRVSQGVIK